MTPFRYHVFVCRAKKPEGVPGCEAQGAAALLAALEKEIAAAGLTEYVQVTGCDCLGLCRTGPNVVVFPEGVWYRGVKPEEAAVLVREHLGAGRPVERLRAAEEASLKTEIVEHRRRSAALKKEMEETGVLPEEFNNLVRGFMESRTVLTALELNLFTALERGATAAETAERLSLDDRATEMLLHALVALGLVKKEDGIFRNTPLAARYLSDHSPASARLASLHSAGLWHRWSTLTDCVKRGTSVALERGESRSEEQTRAFIAAMHRNAAFRSKMVVSSLDLAGVRKILDLGAGSGAYSLAFAQRKPESEIIAFDLPVVIPLTEQYIAEAGGADRIKTQPGDMLTDHLGSNYDLVWVSAICHIFSPEENQHLFCKIHDSLNPGGRLVIQDFILNDDKTGPRTAALFALNMLVNTKKGSSYSRKEYTDWLMAAGFESVEHLSLPGPTGLLIGRKARTERSK